MAEAYKAKVDVSLPRALRELEELVDGQKLYETEGRTYDAGEYVLAEDITPPLREKAEKGELDHLLESVSREEAEAAIQANQSDVGVFIPEHEAERVVLEDAGHTIVPRDQVLELKSAGADAARDALEAAKADGADERPLITDAEVPSLVEVSNGDETAVVPKESTPVSDEELEGVEQPPGLNVGKVKEAAEASEEGSAPKPRRQQKRKTEAEAAEKVQEAQKEQS